MKSERPVRDVVIVGAGFSGTMAAAELTRRGLSATIVEGGGRIGRGTAYSTTEAAHLLNVPAAKMSAWRDAPGDFVAAGHAPDAFAERRQFGAYLGRILDQAVAAGAVDIAPNRALSARREGEGWAVTLDDGRLIEAAALVLAQGNQPPAPMAVAAGIPLERFVNDPWRSGDAVKQVASSGGDALILGTGLTMVDMVLSLDAAGHGGRIVALSRRGQMPRAHAAYEPVVVEIEEVPLGNVLALWRWLRRRSRAGSWRAAVDALRPHSHAIWRSFDVGEQQRFLRHARPWWDVHRHRIAPRVAERLGALIGAGRLEVVAGRVRRIEQAGDELAVEIERRGAGKREGNQFAVVFNCTGPLGNMAQTRDPLLRQMIDDGLVAIHRLGMGIEVDAASRAGPGVWALGPLTKGVLWEIVAVPDIRGQVADVADDIAKELKS
ncbi:MAG: FAD/NAD(P)-binding protein [Sphingomonas bacterium]|nr:FAD/NAD(P)-binding protein [Sphingomonas bacterium]